MLNKDSFTFETGIHFIQDKVNGNIVDGNV